MTDIFEYLEACGYPRDTLNGDHEKAVKILMDSHAKQRAIIQANTDTVKDKLIAELKADLEFARKDRDNIYDKYESALDTFLSALEIKEEKIKILQGGSCLD
jgi:hypothetical protein